MIKPQNTFIFILIGLMLSFVGYVSILSADGIQPGFGLSQTECETLVTVVAYSCIALASLTFTLVVACATNVEIQVHEDQDDQ